MKLLLSALALGLITLHASAQVVLDPPAKIIDLGKGQVTCLAIAPKGDRILMGTDRGAELRDLESGKRVAEFPYNENGSTTVYHGAFNDNGEYVVLIGFAGTREVWDVKTEKQDKRLAMYKWIPDAIRTRDLGLKKGNSDFDRFYQQGKAEHGNVAAHADKEGTVIFTDPDGNALQTLAFPENKDKLYRAPCLFHDDKFITGTDNGRVLFYDLAKP
ncbi:MAG: hypothetical protein IPO60_16500 [Flavobacteriales bacterium]|jgi:WD40 repeat protein|nr:hypothetical protein [Flavobacteriales bacterium]MBK7249099.1 hypothetical protein [Flavobacteriales bacterium]MBK7285673.1 hypothetical protein [Flavobacteriales bacterium]MBK9058652.1 hypothetical protein [Flavobacteriales bacterium]MBK9599862.1 hypothetical protein [Flavobacteriales bacterium]